MKAVSIALSAGILGCSSVQLVPAADAATYSESVLYSFCSQQKCADGALPYAGLIDVKGTLYGAASGGGGCTPERQRCGTVFSLDPATGTEAMVYSFCSQGNCLSGANPPASLLDVNGKLYGTTVGGGTYGCGNGTGCGTVFSLDPGTGAEKVRHSFGPGTDGRQPDSALIAVNGILYGTTAGGGTNSCGSTGCGTVFSLDPKGGAETVLYSFCSQPNCADGAIPSGSLIAVNGILYGMTTEGGTTGCYGYGCGTVFSLDPATDAETVLYSFCGNGFPCADGQWPEAGFTDVNGTLYATTADGGTYGSGTVFAFDPGTAAETLVYSFCSQTNCTDGYYPADGLIAVKGALYGTAEYGGAHSGGTVFALDPATGAQTVLYSFCSQQDCTDGGYPVAGVLAVKGTLYGTTILGGTYGYGTAFALTKNR